MIIHCTKALLIKLGGEAAGDSGIEPDPFFSWHAKAMSLNHKTAVVFTNDLTRYTIAIYILAKEDFQKLSKLFIASLRECLYDEGMNPEIIRRYLDEAGETVYQRTKSRSLISHLNHASANVEFYSHCLNPESHFQRSASRKVNGDTAKYKGGSHAMPKDALCSAFLSRYGEAAISCPAAELRIKLDLFKNQVWRDIIVPLHYTFADLHNVIQTAFDWQGLNLHDFYVFDGDSIVANIISPHGPTALEDGIETIVESEALLRDYLPKHDIVYRYDFTEDWTHMIEAKSVVVNYPSLDAVCTAGFGHRPPESVSVESFDIDEFFGALFESLISFGPGVDLDTINYRLKTERNSK